MERSDRRSFLKVTGTVLAGAALGGGTACTPGQDASAGTGARPLQGDLLRAVAAVVLPASALGEEGIEEAVQSFEAWIAGFEPVAELEHGYGTSEIRYGPPDPGPGWAAQLEGLEIESTHRFERSFAALAPEDRRRVLEGHLAAVDALPSAPRAPHVALGLLAHFYDSPRATDLCYGRLIRKETCRGLADVADMPPPLDGVEVSRTSVHRPGRAGAPLRVAGALDRGTELSRGS